MKRVGVVGLWHETNTYSARATTLESFREFELLYGDEVLRRHAGTQTVIGGMVQGATYDLVPILSAGAWPSGLIEHRALTRLLDDLDEGFAEHQGLDGVLLNLHGAIVGQNCDDPDLELVRRIRRHVGDAPIAGVLDLHANPSPELAATCDVLIAYDTYPHVDMSERGVEAAQYMSELLAGRRLKTSIAKVPVLATPLAQATDTDPMRELQSLAEVVAAKHELDRVSLLPGFPYSDIPRAGFSVLVVSEADKVAIAGREAANIADEVERRRGEFSLHRDGPSRAVAVALRSRAPVVLVDVADNVGGGSPGDGTALLSELLRQGAQRAVIQIADAEAVRAAHDAGVQGELVGEIGGKTDRRHGDPVHICARVVRLESDTRYRSRGSYMTGVEFSMGSTAVVKQAGVTVVLTQFPIPPFHREQLEAVAIDLSRIKILVAKGAIAWRSAYAELAATVIEVDTPGVCPLDPSTLPRATTPMRFGVKSESSTMSRRGGLAPIQTGSPSAGDR